MLSIGLYACNQFDEIKSSISTLDVDNEIEVTDPKMVNKKELNRVIIDYLMGDSDKSRSSLGYTVSTIKDDNGNDAIYVVNFANDGGFVLVSAVKNIQPILAYSNSGYFSLTSDAPLGLKNWRDMTVNVIKESSLQPIDSIRKFRTLWKQYEKDKVLSYFSRSEDLYQQLQAQVMDSISKWNASSNQEVLYVGDPITGDSDRDNAIWQDLLSSIWPEYEDYAESLTVGVQTTTSSVVDKGVELETKWDQTLAYCTSFPKIPTSDGGQKYASPGCTTVAAAQVMHYHNYPESILWNDMPHNSGNQIISNFFYELATKARNYDYFEYEEIGTAISFYAMTNVIKSYGYNAEKIRNFSYSILHHNIENNLPVIVDNKMYDNNNNSAMHAFVISKYRDYNYLIERKVYSYTDPYRLNECYYNCESITNRFYLVNWGWGGDFDGFYAFRPDLVNAPGYTNGNFVEMIANIYPKN